jgi:TonB family protein
VRFTVLPDGGVNNVMIVKPCNCEILNKAACEIVMKASPFQPKPEELEGKAMSMEIDIGFRLE